MLRYSLHLYFTDTFFHLADIDKIKFYIRCKQQHYSKPAKMECLKKYYIKFLARQDSRWNVFLFVYIYGKNIRYTWESFLGDR